MTRERQPHASDRLRLLRKRAGLSMDGLAAACGYKTGSVYQRYEKSAEFPSGYLPPEFIGDRLVKGLLGKGIPAITEDEIWSLAEARFRPAAPDRRPARDGKSRQAEFYELAKMLFETINKYNGNQFSSLQIETWSLTLARAEDTERFLNESARRQYIEDRVAEIVELYPSNPPDS